MTEHDSTGQRIYIQTDLDWMCSAFWMLQKAAEAMPLHHMNEIGGIRGVIELCPVDFRDLKRWKDNQECPEGSGAE